MSDFLLAGWKWLLGRACWDAPSNTWSGTHWGRPEAETEQGIKKILVPMEFTSFSMQALSHAIRIARRWQATIALLYVVDLNFHTPPTAPVDAHKLKAELWQAGLVNLGQAGQGVAATGVQVQTLIRQGLPWKEIVHAARECDLVVMGKHKSTAFGRLFSRNTVKRVLESSPCSVIVVIPQAENRNLVSASPVSCRLALNRDETMRL